MVSAILSETNVFDSKFTFGVQVKENTKTAELNSHQSAVKIQAAALNHRDIWILKKQYGGIVMDSVLGSDGVGYVTKNGTVGQRVLINPSIGWDSDERGPEGKFSILGLLPAIGTLTEEEVVVDKKDIVACPEHLSLPEAAALPLSGVTAYRALFTKAKVRKGDHVLVTGIGGGVALMALQFAVAAGAHVYVTSSSPEKIQKAIELGAKGGVNYKDAKCLDELSKLLEGNRLAAIIDGAGGPLYPKYPKLMMSGGIISCYGQTANATEGVNMTMLHVVKNIEIKGSTMGSREEFCKMVAFVDQHKIKPVVSQVWKNLSKESVEQSILTMSRGDQFGKLVIEFGCNSSPKL
ncbi:hypothetical protein G6F56_000855 [Rhizopus delemar]|uniref:Enoyl reductase (ER) domain-containing protein n=1 Tax=Rhizopus stolonifer TaxID=4846 RepID=A0A367JP17_RHIST|nr:hypothetical protein G6F56_000855 [Rhizopus delemar]RCH91668.1 hypothetical protein CU098_005089 [Rhizopus stolonifer]